MRLSSVASLFLAGALAAAGQTPAAPPAAPTPPPARPALNCHLWRVAYEDADLGTVEGVAEVDWAYRQAQVQLTDPVSGQRTTLTAVSIVPPTNDGQTELVLKGATPSLDQLPWPDPAGLPNTQTAAGAQTKLSGSFGLTRAKQADRDFADDVVTVTMVPDDDGDLAGHWHYRADPVTERLRDGSGRIGAFTLPRGADSGSFLGVQTAREEWTQLPPQIVDVRVLDTGPTTYPAAPVRAERGIGAAISQPGTLRRTLFVVGRHFPLWKETGRRARGLEPITTDRTDLTYQFEGSSDDPPVSGAAAAASAGQIDPYEEGWKQVTAGKSYAETQKLRSLDAVLLEVTFVRGVLPGVTTFAWNGAKGVWRLVFSDVTANLRVVRHLPNNVRTVVRDARGRAVPGAEIEQWEATPSVFLPEPFAIEVQTSVPLPLDSINVFASPQGKFNSTPLPATRVTGASPGLYRTGLIGVAKAGEAAPAGATLTIAAQEGEVLTFLGEQQHGYFANGGVGAAVAYDDPSELGTTWHHALSLCAQLAGEPSRDWGALPATQVEAFTHQFVYLWIRNAAGYLAGQAQSLVSAVGSGRSAPARPMQSGSASCNLSLGQHAATLMLRETFIEMMTQQQTNLQNLLADETDPNLQEKKDDALLGFGNAVVDAARRNPSIIYSSLSGGFLNGAACTLPEALDDTQVARAYDDDPVRMRAWKLGALHQALGAYLPQIQQSIDLARGIENSEREKLLKLTGKGFDGVVARLLPRLVKLDPNTQQWIPDTLARGYVQSIADKERELEDLGAASSLDTQLAVIAVTAAVAAPVMVSESAFASFLTWGANGVLWGTQSAHEVFDAVAVKQEVAFAHGSALVLGSQRSEEAKLQDTEWWKTAASIVGQGILANLQGLDALSKYGREMSILRGADVMEETAGLQAFRRLPPGEMGDAQAFIIDARASQVAGEELTAVQRSALATWEQLAAQTKLSVAAESQAWQNGQALRKWAPRAQTEYELAAKSNQGIMAAVSQNAEDLQALQQERQRLLTNLSSLTAAQQEFGPFEIAGREKYLADLVKANQARLEVTQAMIDLSIMQPGDFFRVTAPEIQWLTGAQKEVDLARMEKILGDNAKTWKSVVDQFETRNLSSADMHQFITWRKQVVDQMLDGVIKDVEAEMTKELRRPIEIERKAFGSTNLTSDYDISVGGPGAERVVGKFNDAFRAAFGGLESGFVFDTNVYTDPVYKLFATRQLTGAGLELGAAEMDTVRQFIYDQVATRKYAPDKVWLKHRQTLLDAAKPDSRAMIQFALDQAEVTDAEARQLIAARQEVLASGGSSVTSANTELRAGNDAYSDVLLEIDGWRNEFDRMEQWATGKSSLKTPSETFLNDYPNYRDKVNRLDQLIKNGGDTKTLVAEMRREVIAQMRDRQGLALYFASEAYESEGTIIHVVDELQGPKKRFVTLESLKAPPVKTELDELSYINSFNENRANMIKEFGHLGVYGGGHAVSGEKLAAKSAKYFIRQLDAARQAGIDVAGALGEDLLALTIKIDANRGTLRNVAAVLSDAKTTGNSYVEAISNASDQLAGLCVQHEQFADLSHFLEPRFVELRELAIEARVEPSVNLPRSHH